ncbi:MAG: hydantoinase B/oxoprolinase family protein, partial [Candidatus Odinarchaeota archaeon]
MSTECVSPIILEVIRNQMLSIVREAGVTLERSGFGTAIREKKDYSVAITDREGDIVAQVEGVPVFVGALPFAVKSVLQAYSINEINPGDIFISNDPYLAGGTHKPDINIMAPFFDHGELVLFTICKGHWTDIGGKNLGSWSPDSTEMFHEGLCIPPIKVYNKGQPDEHLCDMILSNTRTVRLNRGDLGAELAVCFTAARRLQEIFAKHGWRTIECAILEMATQAENIARARIKEIPDGRYQRVEYVDSDGVTDDLIRIPVDVIVSGDEMTIDFSRCPKQSPGPCGNSSLARTVSAVRLAIKCLLAPHTPMNDAFYRPIKVVAPEGSCVNPLPPAPLTQGSLLGKTITEAIILALAEVIPERVMAGIFGSTLHLILSGRDPRYGGEVFSAAEGLGGGWGARYSKDGVNAVSSLGNGYLKDTPAEVLENVFPLRVEQYALFPDTGGPGKYRGGVGIIQDF